MAYKDVRAFLQRLEEEGQLLHVTQEFKLEPDLGACGRAVTSVGENPPALYFDHIYGYEQGTHAVALNVMGSWANYALMLGMPKNTPVKEQFFEFARRWDHFPVPVKAMKDAPFYEHEVTKERAFRHPQFRRFFGIWVPTSERIEACRKQLNAVIPAYLLRRRVPLSAG